MSAHMFQKLSYSLCGLCLSLLSLITLPQTVRLFYVSLRSQAPKQQYTVLSFSSMRRHGHSHKTDLFNSLWAYLSQKHRPNLRYYTVGIPFGTSRKRQSQKSKLDGKTTIPRAPTHMITHYCYVRVTERYTETLHVKKMADFVAVSL